MVILERGPKVIVLDVLQRDWNAQALVDARSWAIDGSFRDDRWIHTGWYDDSNPNPQVTISGVSEDNGSPTGWTSINPRTGDPTSWEDGRVYADVWVRGDRDTTDGINPKQYASQLAQRVELVIGHNAEGTTYNGQRELYRLGTGQKREPNAPEQDPVDHRYRVPVLYGYRRTPP